MKISQKVLTDLKNRQEYAFEIVYQEYYRLVYYISFRIVKDEELAKDIMQETFLALMEHIEDYNESGTLKQYLTSIAKNKSLNACAKRKWQIPLDEASESRLVSQSPADEVDTLLTIGRVLSPEDAEIVTLKILFSYNFKEIAEEMNLSLNTIQGRYYKAIRQLKKHFDGGKL